MKKKNLYLGLVTSVFCLITILLASNSNLLKNQGFFAKGSEDRYSITFNSNTNKIGTETYKPLTFHSGSGSALTGLNNSVNFDYVDFANPTNVWQNIKVGGSFTNTQPISGMTKMSITKTNSDAHLKLYWSNSQTFVESRSIEFDTTSSLSVETNFEGYEPNYIKVVALGSKNSAINSMLVEFDCSDYYPLLDAHSSNETMGTVDGGGLYRAGSEVTLTATANPGYQFIGWYQNGVLLGTDLTYNLTTSFEYMEIEGRFIANSYNLVVSSEDINKGIATGTGTFDYMEEVEIIATPYKGYSFVGWYQDSTLISNEMTYTFNMPYNSLSYVAKFNPSPYVLTLINDNPSYGTISGGKTYNYTQGVSLSASPHLGYSFVGWYENGELVSSENPYNFTMPFNNLDYSAKFSINTYELTLSSSDEEKGSVSGSGTFAYASEVTIIATAEEGYQFIGWYDDDELVSENDIYKFAMPHDDLDLTALFVKKYKVEVYNMNEEWGAIYGEGDFGHGTSVTITGVAYEGYWFYQWYGEFGDEITYEAAYTFTMPENDVVLIATFTDVKPLEVGDKYYLGSYPQTKVTDSSLISTLNNNAGTLPTSANSQSWTSYNYYISRSNTTKFMWYKDISVGQDSYRGVYFTSYRPLATSHTSSTSDSYQDDNGYLINTRYWFKFEPISWDVLSVNEEAGPLVLSSKIIDSQEYYHSTSNRTIDSKTVYPNNYKESNIRTWLNDGFLNTAFSSSEQSLIKTTNVDNSVYSTGYSTNSYAITNTDDKLFLPSYRDAVNADYGFSTSKSSHVSRARSATDYAKAMGIYVNSGNSNWWLRSPDYDDAPDARRVSYDGGISDDGVHVTRHGVLPAFRIKR